MLDFFGMWLAAFGITFTLAYSHIFEQPRAWLVQRHNLFSELFSCAFCLGAQVSAGLTVTAILCGFPLLHNEVLDIIIGMFGGGSFVYLLNDITLWLERE